MKNILVIGSNSFIAKNTVDVLSKNGYNCVLTSRTAIANNVCLDITSEKSILEFCQLNSTTIFDGILFFQGINPSKNTKEISADDFIKMLSVNLVGPTLLLKHFHKNLNSNAMLLFLSSIAATKGSYDPSYASAKAGMLGMMQSFANEFPSLRFNAISLGLVENSPVYNNMTEDFRQKHASKMNNKFIQVGDVASTILELIQNISINKTTIHLDGGFKN